MEVFHFFGRVTFSYSCSIFEYFEWVNVVLNKTFGIIARHQITDHWGPIWHLLLIVWRVQISTHAGDAYSHWRNWRPLSQVVRPLLHVILYVEFGLLGRDTLHGVVGRLLKAFALGVLPVEHLVKGVALIALSRSCCLLPVIQLSCLRIRPFVNVGFSNRSFEREVEVEQIIDLKWRDLNGLATESRRFMHIGCRHFDIDSGIWDLMKSIGSHAANGRFT